jgi:transketolase
MQLRSAVVDALYSSGGGHYGGCLSVLDILWVLYSRLLRVSPEFPLHPDRDRLILSKGHAALSLYAVLQRLCFLRGSLHEYASFRSNLEGHPDMTSVPGVDFSTGSLGQGLSVGLGMAYALRARDRRVWVVLGDGECQEGQIWEAATLGAICELSNLVAIVDHNRFQEWGWSSGRSDGHPPVANIAAKFHAFGWRVIECDGHDFAELERGLRTAADAVGPGVPSVVIAHTTKGKGVPMIEKDPIRFHCETVSQAEHDAIVASLVTM